MKTPSRSTAIALLVAGAIFMENLDGTVAVTAMPQMAQSFGVHPIDLNVGVSAYMLTLAVLIPASGWAATRFGARSVFSSAIVVFTLASVLCGFSGSLTAFTLARILQGAGGAMMVPVGRLAVLRSVEKHKLMSAIATITWPGLAAPLLGPPVGGFLTTYASWHWIFFMNVPFGLIAFVLALRIIPKGQGEAGVPFDRLGFLLTGLACLAFMYGIDLVSRDSGAGVFASLCLLAAVLVGAGAVVHANGATHPLVDFKTLAVRSFAVTVFGGSLFRITISAVPFLLPLLFQVGFGLSAFESGLLVLSVFAGNIVMKPMTTAVLQRFGFRTTLIVNGLLNAAAMFACACLTPATPIALIVAILFASGLTRSMQYTALNTLAFADMPQSRMAGANTLFNVAQQMAMGMGVAVGAMALRAAGLLFPGKPGAIPLASFHIAFAIIGVGAALAIIDAITLNPSAGDAVRQRRTAPAEKAA